MTFNSGPINIGNTVVKFGLRNHKYASDMITEAIEAGYKHVGGYGFACKHCKDHHSAHKFIRGKEIVFCCHKCSACWGNMIKADKKETTLACEKCGYEGQVNLVPSGPHTKASCRNCGAYIKMVGKSEMNN